MNDLFRTIADGLKRSSLASKLTAGLVAMAVVLAVGVSAFVANRPHYSMLLSGLSGSESASAMRALAEAGIAFEASQPPGPFVIYVDDDDRGAALGAIYQSGAMIPIQKGIPADESGMASVFMSNGERMQQMKKHEWGETEKLLESLDFVANANVMTSTSAGSPFSATPPRRTATVQLTVRNVQALTVERALGAVMMVSHALEIAPDDIVLTDQTGKLWNGAPKRDKSEETVESWLEHKQGYDERLSIKANAALADILGPNRARVEIDSLWNFDKSTTSEQLSVDGALRSKTKNLSETPIDSGSPSATGAGSNLDVGSTTSDSSAAAVSAAPPARATTSEEKFEYDPSVTRKETVRTSPTLERLSVALFLDSSIAAADRTAIESAVKAAVGYDLERKDTFSTVSLGFAVDDAAGPGETAETGEVAAAGGAPEEAEPSAMTRMIIRRGVEIVVAVAFIGLLLSSLRSSKKAELARGTGGAAVDGDGDVDPELLAQAQVQDLLTSDPKRVGEILSEWARDAKAGAAR
jgi:flagellar M-ring protein FliF